MRKAAVLFCITFALTMGVAAQQPLAEPSLTPDGTNVVFVSGGDIWIAPATGGDAHLLVAHPATESRPLISPNGKYLAFVSTRTGNGDIYVLEMVTGELRRLTFDDASEQLDAWAPDSTAVYFSSTSHDIAGMNDIYRVAIAGGTPMPVSGDRYLNEFGAAPSPDGQALAFTARGVASAQWWRKGHSHLDETEIWTLRSGSYERIMPREAKQLWPMWSPDGQTLYFMSDRSGAENIWSIKPKGAQRQITKFTSGRVLWPSIARDGQSIVFERDFGIWRLGIASGEVKQINLHLVGAPAGAGVEHRKLTDNIREIGLSPDGKKLAFIAHGEIFATGAKDGGDAVRVTNSVGPESQITWAPDNRHLAYIANRDGHDHIYLYDFTQERETQLTSGAGDEDTPTFSPDGKLLAFKRNRQQVVVYEFAGRKETVVASASLDRPPFGSERPLDWSPDSRWIAFTSVGDKNFRNAWVAPVTGEGARPVSFLSNVYSAGISWSPDGKFLLMNTSQRTEPGQIVRVDLIPRTPRFQEDQFRDLFRDEKRPSIPSEVKDEKPAEPPANGDRQATAEAKTDSPVRAEEKKGPKAAKTEIVFDGVKLRASFLPISLDIDGYVMSPDGKWLAFVASVGGQQNIFAYSLDELAKEPPVAKQLTATRGTKSGLQFTPDGKELFYLDEGKINAVTLEAPKPRSIAVSAEMDVDFARENLAAFEQGWRVLRDNFFDPKMNGVDWQLARTAYEPHIAATRTPDEMRRVMSLMIGELNASHCGISGPSDERRTTTGRLAVRFDPAEYAHSGKLKIAEVVPLGPAAIAGIKEGEFVTAIDGLEMVPHTNLDSLLEYKIRRKTAVRLASAADGTGARTVFLKPIDQNTEKGLLYKQWAQRNREYVARASQGRLGYVHMIDMSENSLRQLFADLDAENFARDGVIVDVRNNNGGFVNAYALDVLARRHYLNMTPRGFSVAPARTVLGQRSLELPTVLLTNQHSLSDAEDFTEGYRALGLGKVIGEPTAGWIIYTSSATLVDGSVMRVPFTRITTVSGEDMEMHPRPVDIEVQRLVGESLGGKDSQLDTAIRELTAQIDQQKLDAQRKKAAQPAAK